MSKKCSVFSFAAMIKVHSFMKCGLNSTMDQHKKLKTSKLHRVQLTIAKIWWKKKIMKKTQTKCYTNEIYIKSTKGYIYNHIYGCIHKNEKKILVKWIHVMHFDYVRQSHEFDIFFKFIVIFMLWEIFMLYIFFNRFVFVIVVITVHYRPTEML